jgi:DNA-binding PadR family transcriptional regulator
MLSNNEFMILAIIHEFQAISGYKLNQVMAFRGYRAWADLGATSIYVNLKRLVQAGLIEGTLDVLKSTKGPASMKYRCTAVGIQALERETALALSSSREHDRRFDLALSTLEVLSGATICQSLEERIFMLERELTRIETVRIHQSPGISFSGQLLFDRTLRFIRQEIDDTKLLRETIIKEKSNNEDRKL